MRLTHYLILAGLITGLVLLCGCSSNMPAQAGQKENFTIMLSGKMLQQTDLPAGFIISRQGELATPEKVPQLNNTGYQGGYDLTADHILSDGSQETVVQSILVFKTTDPIDLKKFFNEHYPQLTNHTVTALTVSNLGDDCQGYQYAVPKGSIASIPDTSVAGTLILIRKGNLVETVNVIGINTAVNGSVAMNLAKVAEAKLT